VHDAGSAGLSGDLTRFRQELYQCSPRRGDALFELVDAVLCADGPVRSLPELSLVGEHRRGHGGLYAGLAHGRLDTNRLRRALVAGTAAAGGGWPTGVGGGHHLLAAAGSTHVTAADPVPHLRTRQRHPHHGARLVLLACWTSCAACEALAVAAHVHPDLGPLAAAYVIAVTGPLAARAAVPVARAIQRRRTES
jgi:hypothetical protein